MGLADDGVLVRPVTPDDVAFVIDGWLNGYWPDCPCSLVMPKAEWFRRWHVVVENALVDERNRCLVACDAERPSCLFGFIVARPPDVLHWVYVKQTYRGNGFSRLLQEGAGVTGRVRFSSWSEGARRMAFANPELTYDPRIIKEYA
jgi:GNAT superfamily N-acetyltransferase